MIVFGRAAALAGLAGVLLSTQALAADASEQQNAGRASKDCVRVHVAGRSGKIQVRGGGVHLVIQAEQDSDREAGDLQALAEKVAAATCGNAAAAQEEADAVAAADALQGVEVVHENTYGAED